MIRLMGLVVIVALASVTPPTEARAAEYQYDFSGADHLSFQGSDDDVIDYSFDDGFLFYDAGVYYNGEFRLADQIFRSDGLSLNFSGPGLIQGFNLIGPPLFSGPTNAPIYKTGHFSFTDPVRGRYELTVTNLSAVPEPAVWSTMIGGIGILGRMSRRRRVLKDRIAYV